MKVSEIDEVVLVGGSTRVPKIQEIVKDFFHGKVWKNVLLCRGNLLDMFEIH